MMCHQLVMTSLGHWTAFHTNGPINEHCTSEVDGVMVDGQVLHTAYVAAPHLYANRKCEVF